MAEHVTVFEVGPRDGLQNQPKIIATSDKIRLIDALSGTGLTKIEVASFVSPKWVPQMADSAAVLAGIQRFPGVSYAGLTPNMRGYQDAVQAKSDEVAIFASASEGFSQKNIHCSIAESYARFAPIIKAAKQAAIPVRGYISCVTDCPYDGPISPGAVAEVAQVLWQSGCYAVSLGDTIGHATPMSISAMLDAVLNVVPAAHLAGHYHDTQGRALANIEVSLAKGLRTFDSAVAGLGGCPYAPGASGNVATESVLRMLHQQGYTTDISETAIEAASAVALEIIR